VVENKIERIKEKYPFKIMILDFKDFNRNCEEIKSFVEQVLSNKKGKTSKKNSSNKKIKETKSPKRIKKGSSISQTNSNSPFIINLDLKSSNFTQKRTHSVKKNLSEIFSKLTILEG